MTSPIIDLSTLRAELAPYTPNADDVAANLLPFVNEHLAEAYLAGRISSDGQEAAAPTCPLGCGAALQVVRSTSLEVTGAIDIDDVPIGSTSWELRCEKGHVLDRGGDGVDSRSAAEGWRRAHEIGRR